MSVIIPPYPATAPVSRDMAPELSALTASLTDGHCELLFGSLFLYRNKYHYAISRLDDSLPDTYVLFGDDSHIEGGHFFSLFGPVPPVEKILPLLDTLPWKQMSESYKNALAPALEAAGCTITEDRDNFDYLYLRSDLAALSGKRFHKKKNLVNAFNAAYRGVVEALTPENAPRAQGVLDAWEDARGGDEATDHRECTEALANLTALGCTGVLVSIDGKAVGFSLGEPLAAGRMFCTHFEKAIDDYKGIFQFVNQAQALSLPDTVEFINREQDVGDEGLRQAKLTYRPAKFVVKYSVKKADKPR